MLLRGFFACWASRGAPDAVVVTDQFMYWFHGQNLANGRGYVAYLTNAPTAYNPPGWPMLLGATFAMTSAIGLGHYDVTAVVMLQITLSVLIVWLVYLLAEPTFGRRVGLAASAIVALWPSQIASVATFSVENAFTVSYLAALLLVVRADWSTGRLSNRRLVAFGLAIGISAQVRPFSLPLLLAVCGAALLARSSWRVALRSMGISMVCALFVFVPWTIRNAVQMDAFVPSSTNLGDTLCMSRFPGSDGSFSFASHPWCADPTLPEVARNSANVRAALRFVVENPAEEVRLVARRFARMMAHDHVTLDEVVNNWGVKESSRSTLPVFAWASDAYYWLVLAAALLGVLSIRGKVRQSPRAPILMWASFVLLVIPLGLWGAPRFHVPFLPLLAIFAACGLEWLTQRLRVDSSCQDGE